MKDWIEQRGIKTINWPPQSPDMNPIENCFSYLKANLKNNDFQNKQQFKNKIKNMGNIPKDYCSKIVRSMEERIMELYEKNGGYTKY